MTKVNEEIYRYIMERIYPSYEKFGRSHDCSHFSSVFNSALALSRHFDVNQDMVAVAAACHDLGLAEDRETHHLVSGRLIRENQDLRRWFSEEQIEIIAQAAEDHRASSDHEPRSIYGKIIADADHLASMSNIIQRTVEYSLEHTPELDMEGHWQRCRQHLKEKYSDKGYLKVWLPQASDTDSLKLLRDTIRDEGKLRAKFNEIASHLGLRCASVQTTGNHKLLSEMLSHADPAQVAGLSRFFKTGPGQYGEGDRFLGIKVPVTRSVVKKCWRDTGFEELEECIRSEYHEIRLAAALSLVQIFSHAKKDEALKRRCVDFYLGHTGHINNWDLVDLSCYEILGRWLLDKDRSLLYDLAGNGKTIWEQRIGMVSTMQFIRHGELDDTYAIAEIFLEKPQPLHDLLQKAAGWLLRDAGKRDEDRLRNWLDANIRRMPRTMLRYAIEKFPEEERKSFLSR